MNIYTDMVRIAEAASKEVRACNISLYRPMTVKVENRKYVFNIEAATNIIRALILNGTFDVFIESALKNLQVRNFQFIPLLDMSIEVFEKIESNGIKVSYIRDANIYVPEVLTNDDVLYIRSHKLTEEYKWCIGNRIMMNRKFKVMFMDSSFEWSESVSAAVSTINVHS